MTEEDKAEELTLTAGDVNTASADGGNVLRRIAVQWNPRHPRSKQKRKAIRNPRRRWRESIF